MDAHRVEVLDRADDHAVVVAVAHDFHFELLPAEQGFFDEDFGNGREVEAAGDDVIEFLAVVGDAASGSAHGEARADDEREGADILGGLPGFVHGLDGGGLRHVEADFVHGLFEELAVLALLNGVRLGSDHFDAVLLEDAGVEEFEGEVEGGLAAEGGEEGGRALLLDDLGDGVDRKRLDVGDIGELRVCHDRGRVGVDQNDFVAFFF